MLLSNSQTKGKDFWWRFHQQLKATNLHDAAGTLCCRAKTKYHRANGFGSQAFTDEVEAQKREVLLKEKYIWKGIGQIGLSVSFHQ